MITRREFLQASVAASAIVGASGLGNWSRLAAQQALSQDQQWYCSQAHLEQGPRTGDR